MWIIVGILLILLILYVIITYNKLIILRNRVDDQFSQVDIQLKRRFDLIPNLINSVKEYVQHETETLEKIVHARENYVSASSTEEKIAASDALTGTLNKLFSLTESYPELKSNENFLKLQTELRDTEDKIAIARQFHNDIVLTYNNKVEMFPSKIVALMFNFKTKEFFKASHEEKENVKVEI